MQDKGRTGPLRGSGGLLPVAQEKDGPAGPSFASQYALAHVAEDWLRSLFPGGLWGFIRAQDLNNGATVADEKRISTEQKAVNVWRKRPARSPLGSLQGRHR